MPTGKLISPYEIMSFLNLLNVAQFQIIQEDLYNITIKCVNTLESGTLDKIKSKMEQLTDSIMNINFEFVDTIPADVSGKYRAIISKI